jgi:tRNA (cmo5U34)-methyltransferase
VSEWEWDPDTYAAEMAAEIPGYGELQEAVVAATAGVSAGRVLELGTGTGETALRVRAVHPEASWLGIDASEPMLARARERLPDADLRSGRLEDELPGGPFDLVVSALAVHHLDGAGKRDLFARVAHVLRPGGVFVLGDLVVPPAGQDGPIFVDWVMDKPDCVEDQLAWFRDAGFEAEATSVRVDLAVFRATLNAA